VSPAANEVLPGPDEVFAVADEVSTSTSQPSCSLQKAFAGNCPWVAADGEHAPLESLCLSGRTQHRHLLYQLHHRVEGLKTNPQGSWGIRDKAGDLSG